MICYCNGRLTFSAEDFVTWKCFPRYWHFKRVNSSAHNSSAKLGFFVITKKLWNRRSICQTVVTMALIKGYSNDVAHVQVFFSHARTYGHIQVVIVAAEHYSIRCFDVVWQWCRWWCWTVDRQKSRAFLQYELDEGNWSKPQDIQTLLRDSMSHDDVIKWNHFRRNWPFVLGIHRSEFPTQRPVTRSFDAFFDLRLN